MTSVAKIDGEQLALDLPDLSNQDQIEMKNKVSVVDESCENHSGICAICLDKIVFQETALVKGCEHAYCVVCIIRRATYNQIPTCPACPRCKLSFEFLNVHRSLDGRITNHVEYRDDEYDERDEVYYTNSLSLHIGNRRWDDPVFVRPGRQEARPVQRSNFHDSSPGSSREPKMKEAGKSTMGRRAKRSLKREEASNVAAEKRIDA